MCRKVISGFYFVLEAKSVHCARRAHACFSSESEKITAAHSPASSLQQATRSVIHVVHDCRGCMNGRSAEVEEAPWREPLCV